MKHRTDLSCVDVLCVGDWSPPAGCGVIEMLEAQMGRMGLEDREVPEMFVAEKPALC
jgi:hypothetical protein